MHLPSGGSTAQLGQQHRAPPYPQSSSSRYHRTQSSSEPAMEPTWPNVIVPDSRRSPSSRSPNVNQSRTSSPVRRKFQVLGWPPSSQSRALDVSATGSSHLRTAESPTHHTTPPPLSRGSSSERIAATTTGRQRAAESSPTSATHETVLKLPTAKKSNPDRKQTLACLFCRERKIACGRPPEGSPDDTCK